MLQMLKHLFFGIDKPSKSGCWPVINVSRDEINTVLKLMSMLRHAIDMKDKALIIPRYVLLYK